MCFVWIEKLFIAGGRPPGSYSCQHLLNFPVLSLSHQQQQWFHTPTAFCSSVAASVTVMFIIDADTGIFQKPYRWMVASVWVFFVTWPASR